MQGSLSGFPYELIYSSSENVRKSLVKAANSKSKFAKPVKGLIKRLDDILNRVSLLRREEGKFITDATDHKDPETVKTLDGRFFALKQGFDQVESDFKILHRDVTIVLECVQEEKGEL